MHRTSRRASLVRMPRLEILGSLAVLAASLLLGPVLIYFVATVHRSEERSAMVDFATMFDHGGNTSNSAVGHPRRIAFWKLFAYHDA